MDAKKSSKTEDKSDHTTGSSGTPSNPSHCNDGEPEKEFAAEHKSCSSGMNTVVCGDMNDVSKPGETGEVIGEINDGGQIDTDTSRQADINVKSVVENQATAEGSGQTNSSSREPEQDLTITNHSDSSERDAPSESRQHPAVIDNSAATETHSVDSCADACTSAPSDDVEASSDKASKDVFADDVIKFSVEKGGEPGDVILDTGDQRFSCHKSLLTRRCPYFEAMFGSGMKESEAETIHLENVNSKHFRSLLNYLYMCHLDVNPSNVEGMLAVGSEFQVSDIIDECATVMLEMIDVDSCLEVMRLANLYMISDVYHHSRVFALWYFSDVCHRDSFYSAPLHLVINYLQDSYLNMKSEVSVMMAAAEWYAHQDQPCDISLTDFFASVVNFNSCMDQELASWRNHEGVAQHRILKTFVDSFSRPGVLDTLRKKSKNRTRISPMNGRILCIGGHKCDSECHGVCEEGTRDTAPMDILEFDPDSCRLQMFTTMLDLYPSLTPDSGYRACAVGEMVYMIGGEGSLGRTGSWLTTIWRLNTLGISADRQRWTQVGRLQNVRRHHGMCVVNKRYILVIGGIGRYRVRLSSAECFDTQSASFVNNIPDMLHQETAPAVAVHRDSVYVLKNYAQALNTTTWTWSFLELKPHIPGLPIFAHSDPLNNALLVSCFNSESLWLVDLDTRRVQEVARFQCEGGGGVYHRDRLFHFQLCESGTRVKVESYDVANAVRSVVGVLDGAVLTQHFLTVPKFPKFEPSSSSLL